jgi:F0F1-type ATP synthase membrane subunit b/b'
MTLMSKAKNTLEESKNNAEGQAEKMQLDIQKQIDENVNAIKKETETQIASLKEKANQNFSKALDQIVEDLLRIIT